MRSSDTSDAGADGFGRGEAVTEKVQNPIQTGYAHLSQTINQLSPVTVAVALTALLGATLFVIFDTARSMQEARGEIAIVASALADDVAALTPQAATLVLGEMAQDYSQRVMAALARDWDAERAAPLHIVRRVDGGAAGEIVVAADSGTVLAGVVPRATGAFVLALLISVLSIRRREASPEGDIDTLIGALPFGIACWNGKGEMLACNDRYRDSIGEGTQPRGYSEALKRLFANGYVKLVSDGASSRMMELNRADGTCLMIDERPFGKGFVTLISDVTERKRTDGLLAAIREEQRLLARRYHEEKLKAEAASRSKTNFLAHLSHDIRTPLNHIIGFAELIRHQTFGPLGDARYLEYIGNIKASGERLLDSFATILDLAELESGQKALRSEPVVIDEVLAAVATRFKPQATRAGVRFQLGGRCGAVMMGDQLGLQRMLGNVIENALRFTPHGGRVTLAAFAATDGVVIEVTDTGLGMSEERLASLSQPFALGDATFTREGVGPGLGIPIARAIAELSGGRMAIDSSPALGTTVAFSLPVGAVEHDATAPRQAA